MEPHLQNELPDLNEHGLQMMMHMAQHDESAAPQLIAQIRRELIALDPASRRRAAERSLSLLDFRLCDEPLWRSALAGTLKIRSDAWPSSFPRRTAVDLARRVLTLAWMTACSVNAAPRCAQLGVAPRVAQLIGQFKLGDLERIADRHVLLLQPRWPDRPDLWRRLLNAARANQPEELQSIDVHWVQLLARELLAHPA